MEPSDEELYRRMRRGDKGALEELYERREPGLYRYSIYMSGSPSVAEEVTHEVFVRLIGPDVTYNEALGPLEAYLHGIAKNLLREAMRQQDRRAPQPGTGHPKDALTLLVDDEMAAALHAALKDLPAEYRDAVILCDLEERSYGDAARMMQCPVGTVRSRLHRARALLAAKLKRFKNAPRVRSEVAS
jgi:RNA polymerase sigma-70 factor (ECF subfamily)